MVLLALGGVRALWLCEWPAWAFVTGSLSVLALAAADIARHARPIRLSLDTAGVWRIHEHGREAFSGRLHAKGYRGATSIVLGLIDTRTDRRRRERRLCIPVDSVSPTDFSFLHLQLGFAHAADEPTTMPTDVTSSSGSGPR